MKNLFVIPVLISLLFPLTLNAKVYITTSKKKKRSPEQVTMSFYDRGQYENCEEMGIVHSTNFIGFQTKKGLFDRMRKQAGEAGATDILVFESDGSATNAEEQGNNTAQGVLFYCTDKIKTKK